MVPSTWHCTWLGIGQDAFKAVQAGFRQTQHGFVQYAQRLSDNSAILWLAAETAACAAVVFGPDGDGMPIALLASTGGGRALVVRRDGTVSGQLGKRPGWELESSSGMGGQIDGSKIFEKGLKGPAITFPVIPGYGPGAGPKRPRRGFGIPSRNERDGGAASLELDVETCMLDWREDCLLVLGSEAIWPSWPSDAEIAQCAVQVLRQAEESVRGSPCTVAKLRLKCVCSRASCWPRIGESR